MNKIIIAGDINKMGAYILETIDTGNILYYGSSQEVNDARSRHYQNMKNGRYKRTKPKLYEAYINNNLQIRVVFTCYSNEELEAIEEQLIKAGWGDEDLTNKQKSVTRHSSNKDETSTIKRKAANVWDNNPNCKYDKKAIAEIIWCKLNGYKPSQISEIYKDIPKEYISQIGVYKWIDLQPIMPKWVIA